MGEWCRGSQMWKHVLHGLSREKESWTLSSCCCCLMTDALSTSWAWNGSRIETGNGRSHPYLSGTFVMYFSQELWLPRLIFLYSGSQRGNSALSPHYPTSSLHPQSCNHFKDIFTSQRKHVRKSKEKGTLSKNTQKREEKAMNINYAMYH